MLALFFVVTVSFHHLAPIVYKLQLFKSLSMIDVEGPLWKNNSASSGMIVAVEFRFEMFCCLLLLQWLFLLLFLPSIVGMLLLTGSFTAPIVCV